MKTFGFLLALLGCCLFAKPQNVGIGTVVPGARLDVNGSLRGGNQFAITPQNVTAGATIAIPNNASSVVVNDDAASAANAASFTGTPYTGQVLYVLNNDAEAVTFAGESIATNTGGAFVYDGTAWLPVGGGGADDDWTVAAPAMYNNNTGNVGIGYTAPGAKLDVNGDGRFTGTNAGGVATVLTLWNTSGSAGSAARINFRSGNLINSAIQGREISSNDDEGGVEFFVSEDGGTLVRALLIHDTRKLFTYQGIEPQTDDVYDLGRSFVGRWDDIYATSGVVNTSDARQKQDVRAVGYGLETVLKLQPVRYKWDSFKAAEGDKLGFLAQDLQQVIPEVVKTNDWENVDDPEKRQLVPNEVLGVYYSDLIPVLTQAIQDLHAEVETLRARVAELEAK